MIEVKKLTRLFKKRGQKNSFGIKDVSFTINDGEIVAFVGDNGAGKTTTIKAIFGEIHLKSGEVLLNNQSIYKNKHLKEIAFFPDSNNIPLNMKLNDYVYYLCDVNGIKRKNVNNKIKEIYEMLELTEHANKKIKDLSGGWKKRAIMASVLVRTPRYIFLDEPTANLDVEAKLEFLTILKELNRFKITILITSHIIEELQEIANHLVLIKNGEIVYDKSFDKDQEKIIDIYKKFIDPKTIDVSHLSHIYEEGESNEVKQ